MQVKTHNSFGMRQFRNGLEAVVPPRSLTEWRTLLQHDQSDQVWAPLLYAHYFRHSVATLPTGYR